MGFSGKHMYRTLGYFKLQFVPRGLSLQVESDFSSQTGTAFKTYTTAEVVEWWYGEVRGLLNAAISIETKGGEASYYSYLNI